MAKKITPRQQTGRTGEVFVGFLFQNLGQIWHESRSDAGIDCHVEWRNPETGEASNRHIGVQVKSYGGQFQSETSDTFEYFCNGTDLEYWLHGTMPVILVCCRPATQEAYWVNIRERFADPKGRASKKILFDKKTTRLDHSSLPALEKIAAPESLGVYLGSPPKREKLYSNLIRVTRLPARVYVAETRFTKRSQVFAFLKEKNIQLATAEFITRNNKIISANDLKESPWNLLVEVGTVESFEFGEWLNQSQNHRFYALELLHHCLQAFLFAKNVRWHKGDGVFYFKAAKGQKNMKIKTSGLRREKTSHTVVKSYYKKTGIEIAYVRHHAIRARFMEVADAWYLQITPTYRFTRDGWRDDQFGLERLKMIKQFEGNQGVFGIARMWCNYLAVDTFDAFARSNPHVGFGEMQTFEATRGIPDEAWQPIDGAASAGEGELPFDFI